MLVEFLEDHKTHNSEVNLATIIFLLYYRI